MRICHRVPAVGNTGYPEQHQQSAEATLLTAGSAVDPAVARATLVVLLTQTACVQEFDAYLKDAVANPSHTAEQRHRLLADWEKGPSARRCHPREEHLLPLMVVAGAANYTPAEVVYSDRLMGAKVSGYMWS